MKTHSPTQDQDSKTRAAARQAEQPSRFIGSAVKGTAGQHRQQNLIDTSPYMAAQRKRLTGISGPVIQNQGLEDEELLQGKFAAQRVPEEEEELMQGKFAAQRMSPEEEELLQGKFAVQRQPEEDEELLQGKFGTEPQSVKGPSPKAPTQQKAKPPEENRTGLPDAVKSKMETAFGTDFSDVKVHPNSTKAVDVDALAYTQGADVHFAPGQFKPESPAGQQLLGHELTHVVQQSQGKVKPTREVAGLPINDSPALENEADRLAEKVSK